MREIRSYGSVGVPAGNRRHYPENQIDGRITFPQEHLGIVFKQICDSISHGGKLNGGSLNPFQATG